MPRTIVTTTPEFDAFVEANPGLAHDADVFGIDFDETSDVEQLSAAIEAARVERMQHTCQRCGSYVKDRVDLNDVRYCPACHDAVAYGKKHPETGERISEGNPEYLAAREAAAKVAAAT